MREVIFKELTSLSSRKKNVVLKEVFEKDGVMTKTERRSFYFIKEVKCLNDGQDLENCLKAANDRGIVNNRRFQILKKHSDETGEDKVICKISGTFYAILDKRVYTIAFMSCFKACIMKATLTK